MQQLLGGLHEEHSGMQGQLSSVVYRSKRSVMLNESGNEVIDRDYCIPCY